MLEVSSVERGRVSLDGDGSNYSSHNIRRLASALEYVTKGGVKTNLSDRLQAIERNIEDLRDQMSQHYTKEPFGPGVVKVSLIHERRVEADKINERIALLSDEKEDVEARLRNAEKTYGEAANSITEAMINRLAEDLFDRDRAEAHRVLLDRTDSVVVNVYYDDGKKVLVLDDVIGRILEIEGHVRLPRNVVAPNGNPLTARAATNLCIADGPNGVIGAYRGYGKSVKGKNEGRSSPFKVLFKKDDVTPIKPLPQDPLFQRVWKEEAFGDEDMRITRYNGGYFGAFVVAREPNEKGIEYSGAGVKFSMDLKVEDRFLFMGLPNYSKDFVPRGKINGHYVMEFRPSPPEHSKEKYPKYFNEHPGIWIARSDDLKLWEVVGPVLRPLKGESKIGGGTPPVRESEGDWTYIHGVKGEDTAWRDYYGRAVLFEAGNPMKPIRMTDNFLLPEDHCDRNDEYKIRHVFPRGAVQRTIEIGGRREPGHIVSAGTADKSSSLYFVLNRFRKETSKPIDSFKFS